jgi:hypothetical protein
MVQRSPEQIAFPELSPTQVACVAALGERRSFQDGESLVRGGQKDYPFWVVESGEVSIIDSTSGEPREASRMQRGRRHLLPCVLCCSGNVLGSESPLNHPHVKPD